MTEARPSPVRLLLLPAAALVAVAVAYAAGWLGPTSAVALLVGLHVAGLLFAAQVTGRLDRESRRLALALDVSKTGVFDTDTRRQKLRWSRYHEILWGYPEGGFDGSRDAFRSRLHPDDRDWVVRRLAAARETGEAYEIECRVVWPDGSVHWVLARGQHFRDRRGRFDSVVGTVVESTERKQIEEALEEAVTRAEAANRAKSAFLANVSHELRTPLAVMLGFSEMLVADLPVHEATRGVAERIHRNGQHLLAIIEDLLDLSRIEAGKLTLQVEEIWLPALVDDVVELLRERASQKGLTLAVRRGRLAPDTVRTDPQRLRQILLNVLGNAVKFTEEGGVAVDIDASPAPDADGRPLVAIHVTDTGIGVPKTAESALFRPFSQADGSLSRRYGGTGLGLHLSRRMARALGGELELTRSTPGEGSVFTLTFDPEGGPLAAGGGPQDARYETST